ncbi:MAG: hypothetical protein RIC85_01535 [Gammaproteobacteria bacterium]
MKNQLVICVANEGYEASLEKRKLYEKVPDDGASKHGQVRVIDESGEDYLFPAEYFVDVNLSEETERAVRAAA